MYRKEKLTYDSTRRSSAMKYWQLPYNLSYNRQGTTFLKCAGAARRGAPEHKGHAQGKASRPSIIVVIIAKKQSTFFEIVRFDFESL